MRTVSRERFNSDGVSVPKIIRLSSQLYRTFPKDIAEDLVISLAVLRYLTFSVLGIRHTCCYCYCEPRRRLVGESYDEEELEKFREEDSPLIELLEELMEEFEAKYFFSDEDFLEFLGACWKGRIEGVLEEMEECQATDEQKRKLEEIGVNWRKEVYHEPRVIEVEEEERDLSYWVKRMDEIVFE
jgi:hypothetical protein